MYNYFRGAYYLGEMTWRSRWHRKRLAEYQRRRTKEIVKYAYENVPYYHKKMKELRIHPSEIAELDHLSKLPILRRKEAVENSFQMISPEFDPTILRAVTTSGSTGFPMSTYLSRSEDEFRKAKHLRANMAIGQKPRDRWVVVVAPHHFSEVTRLQRLLGVYAAIPLSVFHEAPRQILALQQLRPQVLDGYSSSLLLLAQELEKNPSESIKPRVLIGGAELIDNASREFIERSFDAQFYDQYASVEFERLAWQCREKTDYHIDSDSVVMEFVDKDGQEVSPGESGEIVCTSLFNFAMPLIRYATGDVGTPAGDAYCPCGRTLPLMKMIEGRKDSMLTLPNGRVLSPLAFGWAMEFFSFYKYIQQYRVIQKRVDYLKIFIKKREGMVTENEIQIALQEHLGRMLGFEKSEVTVQVEFVEEIPLEKSGKLRKVISELSTI